MPPMKDYTYECELNSNIRITINAYDEDEANDMLQVTVKYPEDFKLIQP